MATDWTQFKLTTKRWNLGQRKVVIPDYGHFLSHAARVARDFKEAFYVPLGWKESFSRPEKSMIGMDIPGLINVPDFYDAKKEIDPKRDLIAFFDVGDGKMAEDLREQGYKYVFSMGKSEEIEQNRYKHKELMESLDLPVVTYMKGDWKKGHIIGLKALDKRLQEIDGKGIFWVKLSTFRGLEDTFKFESYIQVKSTLDKMRHKAGPYAEKVQFLIEDDLPGIEGGSDHLFAGGQFFTRCLQGYEDKGNGYFAKVVETKDLPKTFLKILEKITPYLTKNGANGMMSTENRVPEDKEARDTDSTQRCYSADTEVLTHTGWKFFEDVTLKDYICTRTEESDTIEYQRATEYFSYRYNGKMILISNRDKDIECLVTPAHGVWRTDRFGEKLFRENADSLTDRGYIPRTGTWKGEDPKYFILPEYKNDWLSGMGYSIYKEKHCPPLKIPMESWLQFLAIYLSDGSVRQKTHYCVQIAQFDRIVEFHEILSHLPFDAIKTDRGFNIHSVQLAQYLSQFGKCNEKFVPFEIKQLSPRLLNIFLDTYILADGHYNKHRNQRYYYTTSPRLADDLQEISFKAGRLANIRMSNQAGTFMSVNGGKTYKRNFDMYIISERSKQIRYWFETGKRKSLYINKVDYDGYVYCLTVPNHILYVRRNGKPFWSGNSGNPPGDLQMEQWDNISEMIFAAAGGETVEPVPTGKYGVQLNLHSYWAEKETTVIEFSDKVADSVKLRNVAMIDGYNQYIPESDMVSVGSVIGIDKTPEYAWEKALKVAEQVKGNGIEYNKYLYDDLQETLKEAERLGLGKF